MKTQQIAASIKPKVLFQVEFIIKKIKPPLPITHNDLLQTHIFLSIVMQAMAYL